MNYMLCRNRVRNFDNWKRIFDSHASAHRAAGLKLMHLWQDEGSPSHVFFLFEVENIARAKEYMVGPDAQKAAQDSGFIEGDFHFFRESLGYGASKPTAQSTPAAPSTPSAPSTPPVAATPDGESTPAATSTKSDG